ncbi:response regulator transcription factor [Dyadobacter sp. CY107]|uniref:response regulator transcription factor n=1 Tax=Dyadobacter fanqingshengii TaxID=2906443 RepID=UPI001F2B514E|nr:response regulator transcription factor [Dyadobacter fanqingshengii]MCF2505310.1 response regulator transcription factor [Dyadobacter fanqingshengii]
MDIQVAIFEDNKLLRDALRTILNGTAGYKCTGSYENGYNWENDIVFSKPDVILMDIEMPGMNGIQITKLVTQKFPNVSVLIQTVFNDTDKIFNALASGASGYILKSDPPVKFLEAITEVFHGGAPMSPTVAKKVLGFFSHENFIRVEPGSTDFPLTDREKEVLGLMVSGNDLKKISEKAFISYETVRTHVKHIYRKLHVASKSEAVMKAKQQGLF